VHLIKRISGLLLAAAALSGLAAGCGSGSGDSITKGEFIKKADAICAKTDKAQSGEAVGYLRAHQSIQGLPRETVLAKLITAVGLPAVIKEVEEIEALGTPSGEEQKLQAIFSAAKAAIKKAEKDPASTEERPGSPFDQVGEMAAKYGFEDCKELV
jgi:hypothetical protein